jgi:hypothetical protein
MRLEAWYPPDHEENEPKHGHPNWFWAGIALAFWGLFAMWALATEPSAAAPSVSTAKVCAVLEQIRLDYPKTGVLPDQDADMINRAAWAVNAALGRDEWGLLGKSSGNRGRVPGTKVDVSRDHILHIPTLRSFDALTDVGKTSGPCDDARPPSLKHIWKVQADGKTIISEDGKVKRSIVHAVKPGGSLPPTPPPPPTCPPMVCPNPPPCPPDQGGEVIRLRAELAKRDVEIARLGQTLKQTDEVVYQLDLKIKSVGCRPGNILGIRGFHNGCTVTWGPQVLQSSGKFK